MPLFEHVGQYLECTFRALTGFIIKLLIPVLFFRLRVGLRVAESRFQVSAPRKEGNIFTRTFGC